MSQCIGSVEDSIKHVCHTLQHIAAIVDTIFLELVWWFDVGIQTEMDPWRKAMKCDKLTPEWKYHTLKR